MFRYTSLEHVVEESWADMRFITTLVGAVAILALFVTMTGIYGMVRFSVGQRVMEMGIRMAVGATPASLSRRVIGAVLGDATIGAILGLALCFPLSRLWRNLLYETAPQDSLALGVAAAVTLGAAFLSAYFPAFSPTARDPSRILRAG